MAITQPPPFYAPVHYDFAVERPTTLAEALRLASEPTVEVVGFGTTWQKMLRRREIVPTRALFLDRIGELAGVRPHDGGLEVGATTTLATLLHDPLVASGLPLVPEVIATIAGPAIRNWASVGGNVALRYDLCAPLIALGAEVVTQSAAGGEVVRPVAEATVDPAFPGPGEIVTSVRIPVTPLGWGYARFMPRKAHAFALIGVAVTVRLEHGSVAAAGIAMGAAHVVTPFAVTAAVAAIVGREPTAEAFAAAGEVAASAIDPPDDGLATPWYRQELARVGVRRALAAAVMRGS